MPVPQPATSSVTPVTVPKTASMPRSTVRKIAGAVGGCTLVLGIIALGLCWYMGVFGENFRPIEANKAYRSGQVTPESLRKHIKEDNIKCVVNLRGHSRSQWYTSELQTCQEAGIEHDDIKFDPNYLPSPDILKKLMDRFQAGPYPMLMHCRAGADRSGLGSTLYAMLVEHKPLDEAMADEMTWRKGHVKSDSGDRFLELFRTRGNGQDIKDWILNTYPEIYKSENQESYLDKIPADDQKN